ncbi:MAG: hypothetical protein LBM18_00585 [Oscillospiraceae bacterium]|jgi:ribosomal protein S27E|nr:hypothetical protein [Oscillospiraceae bacterium]
MTTQEKVAYLKGLAEGLELGKTTKEEKLISAIIDTLETISTDITELEDTVAEFGDELDDIGEELDAISDDLADVEEAFFGDMEDDDFDFDEFYGLDDDDDEDEDDDECGHTHGEGCCHGRHKHGEGCCHHHSVMYEVTCPGCENMITIDEDVLALGKIQCPNCGGTLEFVSEEEEETDNK